MAYLSHNTYVAPPSNLDMASPEWADFQSRIAANQAEGRTIEAENQRRRDGGVTKWMPRLAKMVGLSALTAGVAPAVMGAAGGSGAATSAVAGAGTGAKAGATSGVMGRLASIFSSPAFETGANTGLALLGMRQSNKSNDQARTDALAYQTKQIELEQARIAAELQNANLDREDARALNAAIQELEKKKFALQQESMQFERENALFARENALFERGIVEKNQAVKDRYNSSISEPAAARLRSILGF